MIAQEPFVTHTNLKMAQLVTSNTEPFDKHSHNRFLFQHGVSGK